jgi:hypothetical protein
VFVVYDENSQGVHFDLGMAFALRKPVMVINEPARSLGEKSFAAMLIAGGCNCGK